MTFPTLSNIEKFFSVKQGLFTPKVKNLQIGKFHNCSSTNFTSVTGLPAAATNLVGIDLPILLQQNPDKYSTKLVVILGQDPYRNPNDPFFQYLTTINTQYSGGASTIFGTPYAYHLMNNNSFPPHRLYSATKFMDCLIQQIFTQKKCDVYLTDLSKIYIDKQTINRLWSTRRNPNFASASLILFKEELEVLRNLGYKEIIILCSGYGVHKKLNKKTNMFNRACVVGFPHFTSGLAKGSWNKLLAHISMYKIPYIVSQI